ncbi:MAG: double zinc ribbon domain-containing protein, partial [Candidatus Dormibacteraceae bacterium]
MVLVHPERGFGSHYFSRVVRMKGTCPSCGVTATSGNRFCMACGAPLAVEAAPGLLSTAPVDSWPADEFPDGLRCERCGGAIDQESDFCAWCGARCPRSSER